jgi:hypothetical protein
VPLTAGYLAAIVDGPIPRRAMSKDAADFHRDALIQKLYDAFEDAGIYSPDYDMVEGVYEDAVEPLRRQFEAMCRSWA